MKKSSYILMTVTLSGLLWSCNELDTYPLGDIYTEGQRNEIFKEDPENISSMLTAVYNSFNSDESITYFGWPALAIYNECRTADFVTATPGYFANCVEYTDNTASSSYTSTKWNKSYNMIYNCNQLLSLLDDVDPEKQDDTYNEYRLQALGIRAFMYLYLVQTYQFTYATHASSPGVPVITEENMYVVGDEGCPRGTVADVYNQIFDDLDNAIEFAKQTSFYRYSKGTIDINVLYAIRARANLLTQNYQAAINDATTVINSGDFTPLTADEVKVPGFNSVEYDNWIWGSTRRSGAQNQWCFSATINPFAGWYTKQSWKMINAPLYAAISDNDPRKLWWINPVTHESAADYYDATGLDDPEGHVTSAAQYLIDVGAPDYTVVKFAVSDNIAGTLVDNSDFPVIRIEEMYLIKAEAEALGGNLAGGKQTLEQFVNNYRWTGSTPYSSTSASAQEFLKDEVWFQRRVEFWGEGLAYFDLLRYGYTMNRKETGSLWTGDAGVSFMINNYAYVIEPDNSVLLMLIPESEIQNNDQINQSDQNSPGQPTM